MNAEDDITALKRELAAAREEHAATSEILRIISDGDAEPQLKPVLDAILRNAGRLCQAYDAMILLRDGEWLTVAAHQGPIPTTSGKMRIGRDWVAGRSVLEGTTIRIDDFAVDGDEYPEGSSLARRQGFRTLLASPLLRANAAIGVVVVRRREVRPFSDDHVKLLDTFAAQAVIAINNVRRFRDVQARTRELSELLQQQTATADILKVIASSPSAVHPVFDAIAERSNRLVDGLSTAVFSIVDDALHLQAFTRTNREADAALQASSPFAMSAHPWGPQIRSGEVVRILDTESDPSVGPNLRELARLRGYRSMLFVPLLRDHVPIGMISVTRVEPGPFAATHVQLLETFAAQAVIAIENVRLFDELRQRSEDLGEALQQQTATADVLKVISRSAFDLDVVLSTLVTSAARLCDAEKGVIFLRDHEHYQLVSNFGFSAEFEAFARANPFPVDGGSTTARAAASRGAVQVVDVLADENRSPLAREYQRLGGFRTNLGVALMREGEPIGVFTLTRPAVKAFTDRQIELVQTFADQAVIAIENARLFDEVQARTRELQQSLENLSRAQDRLVQSEKLASLGQLTAGIAHEIKNPLNFVNNFSALSGELVDELRQMLEPAALDDATREGVEEVTGMLKANLEKVVQHGRRADSIVKNMLLHSREGSGERQSVDLNAAAEESLNLAYHGARAENPQFNVKLDTSLDPAVGHMEVYPQEFVRVLLNLISNGFYAAQKRKHEVGDKAFEPALRLSTAGFPDRVEIRVRDNGTGIPDEVKAKMFNPFFTTKPAGEGTGLGLSLSYDIVVKQHGGTLDVDTRVGEFTEFLITLPRGASAPARRSAP